MDIDMEQYREVFVTEARELLQLLTDSLLALEKERHDLAPVEECFRVAHSLKGMAATMSYTDIADLTHKMENLLDSVRTKRRDVTSEDIDLMLKCCDALQASVDRVAGGATEAPDLESLCAEIERAVAAGSTAPAPSPESATNRYQVDIRLDSGCVLKSVRAYMTFKRLNLIGEIEKTVPSLNDIEDEKFDRDFTVLFSSQVAAEKIEEAIMGVTEIVSADVRLADVSPVKEDVKTVAQEETGAPPRMSDTQTVRVTIGHLDNMVNLVGELVISRARLESLTADLDISELEDIVEELRRTSSELQHTVMQTRMVPVANIFNRFPRMVRDSARKLGKEVDFHIEGLDIELDRTVLDEIGDPLVHLLRNAVGHGVESPEERAKAGKADTATITLRAMREQDAVAIVVEDDGRGLDPDRLRGKAVELGLISEEEATAIGEEEALYLVCQPAFTTAAEATDLSGRGVGMDAVRGKIEALGGSLHIASTAGEGTRFTLLLPLTLAIIQALLVESAGQTYAVPLGSVIEAADLAAVQRKMVQRKPVMILHDQVVPLVDLQSLLHPHEKRQAIEGGEVVVVELGEVRKGLVVERLVGQQEIVIKPLDTALCGTSGISGATVLGDGRVALIIDVRNLQERMSPVVAAQTM